MGQTWGKPDKDLHDPPSLPLGGDGAAECDPIVEQLREHITQPLDILTQKATRHCTNCTIREGPSLQVQE